MCIKVHIAWQCSEGGYNRESQPIPVLLWRLIQERMLSVTSESMLTSTKKASLIITDFLAMIYKSEQPRTASLCRGWAIFENDFNLICR